MRIFLHVLYTESQRSKYLRAGKSLCSSCQLLKTYHHKDPGGAGVGCGGMGVGWGESDQMYIKN